MKILKPLALHWFYAQLMVFILGIAFHRRKAFIGLHVPAGSASRYSSFSQFRPAPILHCRLEEENKRLFDELASKQKECENLQSTRLSLQNKITNMRDQNRAMDATIDNYRKQLDEAKQVIQQKDTEIQQYTHLTRLINELTGNRVSPADLTVTKNPS
uniref:Protein CIP2A n=1 Tax=Mesocestoides corti TaxID=53468 RepID=A0A5K3FG74_MESCO